MTHVRRVMASVQAAHVVDDRIQRVREIAEPVTLLGHERRHVQFRGERDERGDFLVDQTRVLEALQVETRHNRHGPHRQLLRGLLVALARAALDLGTAAQMLGPSEPFQAVDQRLRWSTACVMRFAQVQGNIPERVNCRGHTFAVLADHITLQATREDLINDAAALCGIRAG